MKPARALVRVHFAFLASHFCSAADSVTIREVFNKIFFSFLLFSNSRQKTAHVVWDLVAKNEQGGLGKYELLEGCSALWKEACEPNSVEKMSGFNLALVSRIAGGYMISIATPFSMLKLNREHTQIQRLSGPL
jgi:U3 small nucleolar RNA-associated protein 10